MPGDVETLTTKQVCEITGYHRSWIYKLIARGLFPKPVSAYRQKKRWLKSDIDVYLRNPPKTPAQREAEALQEQARTSALAYAPRANKRARQAPLQDNDQPRTAPLYHAERRAFKEADSERLRCIMETVDDRSTTAPRDGRRRKRFPGLEAALAAGWNGGKNPDTLVRS